MKSFNKLSMISKIAFLDIFVASSVIVFMRFLFPSYQQLTSNAIQAIAVITLVLITWYYAEQTKLLVKEQERAIEETRGKIQIDFLEKRISEFYHPFHKLLDKIKFISEGNVDINYRVDTKNDLLDLFWKRRYMTSLPTELVMTLDIALVNEEFNKNRPPKEALNQLAAALLIVRTTILDEWNTIEKKILAYYSRLDEARPGVPGPEK